MTFFHRFFFTGASLILHNSFGVKIEKIIVEYLGEEKRRVEALASCRVIGTLIGIVLVTCDFNIFFYLLGMKV